MNSAKPPQQTSIKSRYRPLRHIVFALMLLCVFPVNALDKNERFSMSAKNTPVSDVMAMFAQKGRVSIMLSKDVTGDISLNLFDVTLDEAISAAAEAAGFAAEKRKKTYFIIDKKDIGSRSTTGLTRVRSYPLQYADPASTENVVKNYLSNFGKVTLAKEQRVLIVEDSPEFLYRVGRLIDSLDQPPKQILIEAKILEVTLNDNLSYGIDWTRLLSVDPDDIKVFGTQGLASPGAPGLFVSVANDNIELLLDALETDGRLRTISTPKLLALENQEASVVVGDRIGYKVTTTINQVTTESVEFLESGVILRVTPSVDNEGRILLDIYPQISTGSVTDGIPSKTTTEVTTKFLAKDKQTIFIGGLLKNSLTEFKSGVPVLKSIPLLGKLFSSNQTISLKTETVVLITPYIVNDITLINKRYPELIEREEAEVSGHIKRQEFGRDALERSGLPDKPAIDSSVSDEKRMRGPRH